MNLVSFGAYCAALLVSLHQGSGITEANCACITNRMTERDVERILGCPAGDYTMGIGRVFNFRCGNQVRGFTTKIWTGRRGEVEVTFRGANGRVVRTCFLEPQFMIFWPDPAKKVAQLLLP